MLAAHTLYLVNLTVNGGVVIVTMAPALSSALVYCFRKAQLRAS